MNFLDCSYKEKDGKLLLIHEAFTLDLTEHRDAVLKRATSPKLTIGIRPEHIQVADKPQSKDAIKATVYVTEPLGSRSILTFNVGKNSVKAIAAKVVKLKMEESRFMEFDKTKIHIIDSKTEQIIT